MNRAIERPHCDDPGGSVEFRSSLAFETRLPRGHRVQGIVGLIQNFLVSLKLGDSFLRRARRELPQKRSLRTNQWSPADARSHKFRVAHRDAAPASSDAQSDQLASIMANQYFYVRAGVRGPICALERCPRDNTWTRRHGGHGGAHGWRVRESPLGDDA